MQHYYSRATNTSCIANELMGNLHFKGIQNWQYTNYINEGLVNTYMHSKRSLVSDINSGVEWVDGELYMLI